jgi:hypothetical protein
MEQLTGNLRDAIVPEKSAPLRGYLTRERDGQLWIQDQEATWIVDQSDVVARGEWTGGDIRFEGEPVLVFVRDGAQVFEVRPTRIRVHSQPLTILTHAEVPKVKGEEVINILGDKFARHLGFAPWEGKGGTAPAKTTASCWDTGEWATDCSPDDCGPDVC